jgi:hypothetical protein
MTIYETNCGGKIEISPESKNHLQAHPEVLSLLQSAIGQISLPLDNKKYAAEIDFRRIIGRAGVTKTSPLKEEDQALFAVRKGRKRPIPGCPCWANWRGNNKNGHNCRIGWGRKALQTYDFLDRITSPEGTLGFEYQKCGRISSMLGILEFIRTNI